MRGQRRSVALLGAALGAAALLAGGLAPDAGAAKPGWTTLPQAAPALPAGAQQLGAAPADQLLDLDVVLASQNAAGLAQAVAAVSTPGSPDYRHYLTSSQFAAACGPSSARSPRSPRPRKPRSSIIWGRR